MKERNENDCKSLWTILSDDLHEIRKAIKSNKERHSQMKICEWYTIQFERNCINAEKQSLLERIENGFSIRLFAPKSLWIITYKFEKENMHVYIIYYHGGYI